MSHIFGDFIEANIHNQEFLKIGFSPTSASLQQRWRNNGLSADFLADYLSTFFLDDDAEAQDKQAQIKDAVSFVANELLENAMKFTYAPTEYAVDIIMQLDQDNVWFYITNSVDPQTCAKYQEFIHKVLTEDTNELYLKQLMVNAEGDDENSGSGVGFLTMINDYEAELAWKFETLAGNPEAIIVMTMVRLPI